MGRLDGRVALVTGAGQGIGRGIARRYASEGAAVTIAEINAETGSQVAKELTDELGARAQFVPTDVLVREQVQAAVDGTVDAFGSVDILVNCAYVAGGIGRMEYKSDEDLLLAFRGGPLHTFWGSADEVIDGFEGIAHLGSEVRRRGIEHCVVEGTDHATTLLHGLDRVLPEASEWLLGVVGPA